MVRAALGSGGHREPAGHLLDDRAQRRAGGVVHPVEPEHLDEAAVDGDHVRVAALHDRRPWQGLQDGLQSVARTVHPPTVRAGRPLPVDLTSGPPHAACRALAWCAALPCSGPSSDCRRSAIAS
ncbi:hypothetical protein GCM10010341_65530 [Streptomyces noursei]|nr:hypothetical protein GCM10010341_65530 [Streptomyces noursei]